MGKLVQESNFEVIVWGYSSSIEEWQRAMGAPSSELPELNAAQKEVARKFGISEERYARGFLAGLYGQDGLRARGTELGRAVEAILARLGTDYQLRAVKAEMAKGRWVVRIQAPPQIVNVAVPRELADDIIDSDTIQDRERLRVLLVSSFDLIGKQ